MRSKKCLFLDRDGVINKDKTDYVYRLEDLHILSGVKEALSEAHQAGFLLVVITNQSGIDKGLFTMQEVSKIHDVIQELTGNLIGAFYTSPYHRDKTNSLSRKPGSLNFEKAIARFGINAAQSWMVGDRLRDLEPAHKLGIKGVLIEDNLYGEEYPGPKAASLSEAVKKYILPTTGR